MRRLQLAIIIGIILFLIYLCLLWLGGGQEKKTTIETTKDRNSSELPVPEIKTEISINKSFNWQIKIEQLPTQASVYSLNSSRPTLTEAQEFAKAFGFLDLKNQVNMDGIYMFDRVAKDGLLDRMIVSQDKNPTLGIWWEQGITEQKIKEIKTTSPLSEELIENLDKNNQKIFEALSLKDPWKIILGSKIFLKNETETAGFVSLEEADSVRFNYNYSFDNWPIYGQNYGFPIKITYDRAGKLKELSIEFIPTGYQTISENLKTKTETMIVNDRSIKPLFATVNNNLASNNIEDFKPETTTVSGYQLGYLYIPGKKQLWPYVFFDGKATEGQNALKLVLGTSLIL